MCVRGATVDPYALPSLPMVVGVLWWWVVEVWLLYSVYTPYLCRSSSSTSTLYRYRVLGWGWVAGLGCLYHGGGCWVVLVSPYL